MVVTGCESQCHGCGQDVRALCLCTTAIAISIVLVLAGSESQCKCCEKEVCEVCLCTGAIVICRTSVCAAGESPCKCCIEVEYPSPSPSPSCPSHLRPSHHEPSHHRHTSSACACHTPPFLCTTAIVISIVLVLAGSESQCKCCEKEVCEVCLCTGAIVICRTSVCAAGESPCKCCIEVEYPSPSPSPSCPSHLRPSHHEPSHHRHTSSACACHTPPFLCTTAIVISIVLVLAGSESQCKCCEKDVCEVCLCTGAIVICRTSVCAAGESPCKCCIEVEYPSPSPSPSCPSHLRPSHHEPSHHTHTSSACACHTPPFLPLCSSLFIPPLGARLSPQWPAQCPEAAARAGMKPVSALRPLGFTWPVLSLRSHDCGRVSVRHAHCDFKNSHCAPNMF